MGIGAFYFFIDLTSPNYNIMSRSIIFFFLLTISIVGEAQKTDSSFYKIFRQGVDCSVRNQCDSALTFFFQAIAIAEKQNKTTDEKYCYTLNNIGSCYKELAKPQQAHEYMYKALLLARKLKHLVVENVALLSLNNLHWTITKNNWSFNYPKEQTTFGSYNFFPIEKTLPFSEDSVMVVVYAGSNDGINDSSYSTRIYKRYDTALRNHPDIKNLNSIARGRIKTIEPNRTYLIVKRSSDLNIEAYDQANIYCHTPIALKKSYFIDFFKHGINLLDYLKTDRLISRRFLFYYNDEKINFGFIKILKQELSEIQQYLAEDTLVGKNQFSQKATAGIFKGLNMVKALDSSKTRQIKSFINFVTAYPKNYLGNSFSFVEVYATWLLNNTPMRPDDILDYLFTVEGTQRKDLTQSLLSQIEDNKLVEKWVTDGLQHIDKDELVYVNAIMLALANVHAVNKDSSVAGWSRFFNGMYFYKKGEIALADTMLQKASNYFTATLNKEGLAICKQAINKIHSNNHISLEVQAGNFTDYKVAMHPNGKYYATCSQDRIVRIWNLHLGREIKLIQEHKDEVTNIAFSANGRYLASSSKDKTIKIWSTFDYSLVTTIPTNKIEYCIAFSPNDKELASGGEDSLVKIWDFSTGKLLYSLSKHTSTVKQVCYVAKNENILYSSGLDSMVYEWNLETKDYTHWYKKKARLLNMKVSSNGNYLFYTANDTTISVWDVFKAKFYFSQKISFENLGTSNYFGEADFSPDGTLLAFPDGKNRIAIVDLNAGLINTIAKEANGYQYLNTLNFTPDQKSIFVTYPHATRTKLFDFTNYKSTTTLREDINNVKTFKVYANPPLGLQFSSDGSALFTITSRISKFDLTNGNTQHLLYSPQSFYNDAFMVNDSIAMQTSENTKLVFYNQTKKEQVTETKLSNNDTIAYASVDETQKNIFIAGKKGIVEKFKIAKNSIDSIALFKIQLPLKKGETISYFRLDNFRNRLLISSSENTIYSVAITNGQLLSKKNIQPYGDFAITPKSIYFNSYDGAVTQTDPISFKTISKTIVGTQKEVASLIKVTNNFKQLIVFTNETDFAVLNIPSNKIKYRRKNQNSFLYAMAISADNKYLATGGFDSKISLFNIATGEKLLNIFTPFGLDFVAADTNGNYLANKKSLEGLSFKLNDKIFDFDQFDIKFNRPDLILQQTIYGDTTLIEAYKKAVTKRIKKAGYNNANEIQTTQLPIVMLKDQSELELFTNQDTVETLVECSDGRYPIKALHITVNNNPLYGFAGMPLGNTSTDTIINIKIPLAIGKNDIKIFCNNSMGQTSLQQKLEINSRYTTTTKPKTWFVGIGVSNYKNTSMNLRYAAKDIRDLVGTFVNKNDTTITYSIDTLIDNNATLSNILAVKQKLLQANINDKVIIAVTGHGLLNKDLDFYYATYDVDFDNPEKNGLKYEQLEFLLDGVIAQNKLLLIDACHSGALDKEEILASKQKIFVKSEGKDTGSISTDARSTIKIKKSKVSLNNTLELMQNMFADVSNSNGAVVISAAGGLEYAFESPQWNNGVFTYCVRKGIEELAADDDPESGNYDFDVSVQELMKYVSKKVSELTNGQQRPTSRRENLEFDWILKYYKR